MFKIVYSIPKYLIVAGACLILQSCKIDVVPVDRYSEESTWSNPANMELYVNGMYSEFYSFKFGEFPNLGYDNASDALTDILKYTSSSSGNGTVNILAMDASRINASGPGLNYWSPGYTRIRRLNEFIDGATQYAKVDEQLRDQYIAEARFIRGFVYFWLVKLHGSVILYDNIAQYETKSHPRSSEDSCWNFIAADFQFAATHLPKQWDPAHAGRATMGAAYGMLARTWLYAASVAEYDKKQYNNDPLTGVPQAKASAYYNNARTATGEVIKLANEGYYSLASDFASIFTNKNTPEAIFKIDFVRPQLTHQYDLGFAPPGDNPANTLVYGVPTAELVDEFEMKDGRIFSWSDPTMAANPYVDREPRFYASILYNGATWKGRTLDTRPENTTEGFVMYGSTPDPKKTVTGYYTKKFLDPANMNFVVDKSTQSWIEMRYAEILLIDAEARLKTNDLSGARTSLNTLRNKRGLPDTPAQTPEDMMKAIEHERIIELAFEGQRYWDLRRWRKAHIVLNNTRFTGHRITNVGGQLKYEVVNADNADRQFTPALYYLPIIISEDQNNPGFDQIKGW